MAARSTAGKLSAAAAANHKAKLSAAAAARKQNGTAAAPGTNARPKPGTILTSIENTENAEHLQRRLSPHPAYPAQGQRRRGVFSPGHVRRMAQAREGSEAASKSATVDEPSTAGSARSEKIGGNSRLYATAIARSKSSVSNSSKPYATAISRSKSSIPANPVDRYGVLQRPKSSSSSVKPVVSGSQPPRNTQNTTNRSVAHSRRIKTSASIPSLLSNDEDDEPMKAPLNAKDNRIKETELYQKFEEAFNVTLQNNPGILPGAPNVIESIKVALFKVQQSKAQKEHEMRKQLDNAKAEKDELEARLRKEMGQTAMRRNELTKELETAKNEQRRVEDSLKKQTAASAAIRRELAGKMSEATKEKEELTKHLAYLSKSRAELERALESETALVEKDRDALQKVVDERKKLQKKKAENRALEAKIERMTEGASKEKLTLQAEVADLQKFEEHIAELKKQNEDARGTLEKERGQLKELASTMQAKKEALKESKSEMERQYQEELDDLQGQMENAKMLHERDMEMVVKSRVTNYLRRTRGDDADAGEGVEVMAYADGDGASDGVATGEDFDVEKVINSRIQKELDTKMKEFEDRKREAELQTQLEEVKHQREMEMENQKRELENQKRELEDQKKKELENQKRELEIQKKKEIEEQKKKELEMQRRMEQEMKELEIQKRIEELETQKRMQELEIQQMKARKRKQKKKKESLSLSDEDDGDDEEANSSTNTDGDSDDDESLDSTKKASKKLKSKKKKKKKKKQSNNEEQGEDGEKQQDDDMAKEEEEKEAQMMREKNKEEKKEKEREAQMKKEIDSLREEIELVKARGVPGELDGGGSCLRDEIKMSLARDLPRGTAKMNLFRRGEPRLDADDDLLFRRGRELVRRRDGPDKQDSDCDRLLREEIRSLRDEIKASQTPPRFTSPGGGKPTQQQQQQSLQENSLVMDDNREEIQDMRYELKNLRNEIKRASQQQAAPPPAAPPSSHHQTPPPSGQHQTPLPPSSYHQPPPPPPSSYHQTPPPPGGPLGHPTQRDAERGDYHRYTPASVDVGTLPSPATYYEEDETREQPPRGGGRFMSPRRLRPSSSYINYEAEENDIVDQRERDDIRRKSNHLPRAEWRGGHRLSSPSGRGPRKNYSIDEENDIRMARETPPPASQSIRRRLLSPGAGRRGANGRRSLPLYDDDREDVPATGGRLRSIPSYEDTREEDVGRIRQNAARKDAGQRSYLRYDDDYEDEVVGRMHLATPPHLPRAEKILERHGLRNAVRSTRYYT